MYKTKTYFSKNITNKFTSVIKIQLLLCILNGINYHYCNKSGSFVTNYLYKVIYSACTITFTLLNIATLIQCPALNIDYINNFTFFLQHTIAVFYLFSSIIWFAIHNKTLSYCFEKLMIVDGILLKQLGQVIDYKKCRLRNLLRICITYIGLIIFAFCEILYIITFDFNGIKYCAVHYFLSYYLSVNINCLFYTIILEIKLRMRILHKCIKNNHDTERIVYMRIVCTLIIAMKKSFNLFFELQLLNKVMYLFTGCLYFSAYVMSINVFKFENWKLLVSLWTSSFTMFMEIFELVIYIYLLESFKDQVSFVIAYNI